MSSDTRARHARAAQRRPHMDAHVMLIGRPGPMRRYHSAIPTHRAKSTRYQPCERRDGPGAETVQSPVGHPFPIR